MKRQIDEDEGDDEEIWASICKIAGEYADERARTILEDAGQAIAEAVETVLWAVRRKQLPPER